MSLQTTEVARPVTPARAEQLRSMWRQVRRSWLIGLARQSGYPEDRLPLLSQEERAFVQHVRLDRGFFA